MSGERGRSSRRLLIALVGVTALAGSCAGGPAAFAGGGWTRPVLGRVLVAYGDTCPGAGGASRTHQGVDLACGAGDTVVACEGGTVSFSGPVPGDCGARVTAVTVMGDDGLRVTYTPLATSAVATGRRVETGVSIGTVADQGDASSPEPHLHLSVRRGESYLDPAGMLAAAAGPAGTVGPSAGPDPGVGTGSAAGDAGQVEPGEPEAPAAESHTPAGAPVPQAAETPATASSSAASALASLASLRAASAVSPAAAVRSVAGRVSLLAPMQARAGMTVPLPHATGLSAVAGSASSLGHAATTAAVALVVGLAVLACAWRSLWSFAGRAASVTASAALTTAMTTPAGRE